MAGGVEDLRHSPTPTSHRIATEPASPAAARAPSATTAPTALRLFLTVGGLTLANPVTVVYFVALVGGALILVLAVRAALGG